MARPDKGREEEEFGPKFGKEKQLLADRHWCRKGRVPAFKKGWRWYARRGDLQAMVLHQLSGKTSDEAILAVPGPALPRPASRN